MNILHELMGAIGEAIIYETDTTDAETNAEEALKLGRGVCQDHAHVFIAAARSLGVPARYVSGYMLLEGGQDSEAHHAWAEVLLPQLAFGNFFKGAIHGYKFDDFEGLGFDNGDRRQGGVEIELERDRDKDGSVDERHFTVTDSTTGEYWFMGLGPGLYMVREVVPDESEPTTAPPRTDRPEKR